MDGVDSRFIVADSFSAFLEAYLANPREVMFPKELLA